jgi:hypothetical protein
MGLLITCQRHASRLTLCGSRWGIGGEKSTVGTALTVAPPQA